MFVLFRAEFRVTPTRINELLRRLMLAFKSPLALWPRCPPRYPASFLTHTHTHAIGITRAGGRSLIYIASRKRDALLSHRAPSMMK